MMQEPNYHTKLASQICPEKVKLQIVLSFLFFCFAFLQFLCSFTSRKFTLTYQYANCESEIQSQLTGKKCLKSSKALVEDKQEDTDWQNGQFGTRVSYTMKISAKTLGLQANELLLIIKCTRKKLFEHIYSEKYEKQSFPHFKFIPH